MSNDQKNAFPTCLLTNPPDIRSLPSTKDGQQRTRGGGGAGSPGDSSHLEKFAHCSALPGLCFIYVGHQTRGSYFSTDAGRTPGALICCLIQVHLKVPRQGGETVPGSDVALLLEIDGL